MRLSFCCRSVTTTTSSSNLLHSSSIINSNATISHFAMKVNYCPLTKSDVAAKPLTSENKLGRLWREFQGSHDWEGLLDPLDDTLRSEILRYGHFVDSAYRAFDSDPLSPASGLAPPPGYRVTKHLHATCGVRTPGWVERLPAWMSVRSSWIGYVAVCDDADEIRRLGRRDVVIALRGTATCLEWLENLRTAQSPVPPAATDDESGPAVETGFLSLYTSESDTCQSLRDAVREEVERVVRSFGRDEPLSLTITGHSLGAALAILAAYDIAAAVGGVPPATVFSFGGPRVGNRELRRRLEKSGTKILRIVNSDDLVTKVPGFVADVDDHVSEDSDADVARWIRRRVNGTRGYADVGRVLKLSSKKSPYVSKGNLVTCHDLKTYLHLVNGFVSSTCPFKATAEMLSTRFVH